MASIRRLKKDVNYMAYELLTEIFAYRHFHPELEEKKFDSVIKDIVKKRNEIISKINHVSELKEKADKKGHFASVNKEIANLVKITESISNSEK